MLFTESLLAFDGDTGQLIWYDQVRPADPFDLDYGCHPMVFDAVHPARKHETRSCVAAGNKAGMFCFNRYTGQKYWKAMLTNATQKGGPLVNSTAVAYNRVFVVSNSAGIRGRPPMSVAAGLHAYTGDIQWWVANPALIEGPVAVAGEVFYQGLQNGILEAIDAKTGEQLWKHDLPGPIRGGMSIANGALYTSTGTSVDWNVRDLRGDKMYKLYAFSPDGQ
jgi:glucose dehydrogenase